MGSKKKRSAQPTSGDSTFREVLADVEQERPPGAAYAGIRPGEFNDDDMTVLRHPGGELMQVSEWEISLEDAKLCIKSGADLYVNPDDIPFDVRGTNFDLSVQHWLIDDRAHQLYAVEHEDKRAAKYSRISLYKSTSGRLVVHLTGHFTWPDGVDHPKS